MPSPLHVAIGVGFAAICMVYYAFFRPEQQQITYGTGKTQKTQNYPSYDTHPSNTQFSRRSSTQSETTSKCCICLEKVTRRSVNRMLECGHCFHLKCINQWLSANNTCPLCNHRV